MSTHTIDFNEVFIFIISSRNNKNNLSVVTFSGLLCELPTYLSSVHYPACPVTGSVSLVWQPAVVENPPL